MWRDSSGKQLTDYPRPSVAVDVVLLTVVGDGREAQLCVLLHQPTAGPAAGLWCLPGTFVRQDELLADAALRAQHDKAGVVGRQPRQLKVFDALDRDGRGRVLSVAHVDLLPFDDLGECACRPAPVEGERAVPPAGQQQLPYDHDAIVTDAVRATREAYRRDPDPSGLLGPEFTLYDLRRLHDAVAGSRSVKDTFRRKMTPALEPTGRERTGTVGRPAELYRHRPPR